MTITAKPILFSTPMIKALLREIKNPGSGKTQTRRIMKLQPTDTGVSWQFELKGRKSNIWANYPYDKFDDKENGLVGYCPYGKPGDLLYVRETSSAVYNFDKTPCVRYEADQVWRPCIHGVPCASWFDMHHYRGGSGLQVPSIHMPRWASRITLEVTDVRVQRLQDISEEDSIAEGVELMRPGYWRKYTPSWTQHELTAKGSFVSLFKSIHGPDIWKSNPWLWAVSFKPHLINVDRFIEERAALC